MQSNVEISFRILWLAPLTRPRNGTIWELCRSTQITAGGLLPDSAMALRTSTLRSRTSPTTKKRMIETMAGRRLPVIWLTKPKASGSSHRRRRLRHRGTRGHPPAIGGDTVRMCTNAPGRRLSARRAGRVAVCPHRAVSPVGRGHGFLTASSVSSIVAARSSLPAVCANSKAVSKSEMAFSCRPSMWWVTPRIK